MAVILLLIALWTKKAWLRNFVLASVAIWYLFYTALLFSFSITSKEKVLGLNEPKEFCGFYLDCHMHASVTDVRTAKKIGGLTANGTFLIANLKIFSNAKNPNIAFRLLEPDVKLIDAEDRIYLRNLMAENELPTAQTQLNQDIKGVQTIEKEIVFDVIPPDDKFKLLITEGYRIDKFIEAFLVGDEDSIFHQPTVFGIETRNQK